MGVGVGVDRMERCMGSVRLRERGWAHRIKGPSVGRRSWQSMDGIRRRRIGTCGGRGSKHWLTGIKGVFPIFQFQSQLRLLGHSRNVIFHYFYPISDMHVRISLWHSATKYGWQYPRRDPLSKAELVEEERLRRTIIEARKLAKDDDFDTPSRAMRLLVGVKNPAS